MFIDRFLGGKPAFAVEASVYLVSIGANLIFVPISLKYETLAD